jgi:hypothetical protein
MRKLYIVATVMVSVSLAGFAQEPRLSRNPRPL